MNLFVRDYVNNFTLYFIGSPFNYGEIYLVAMDASVLIGAFGYQGSFNFRSKDSNEELQSLIAVDCTSKIDILIIFNRVQNLSDRLVIVIDFSFLIFVV